LTSRSPLNLLSLLAGGALIHRGVTGSCQGYRLFGVTTADEEPAKPSEYQRRGIHVKESLTVNRLPWDLYQFWRNFENLPRFMSHLESVKTLDEKRSHWKVRAPAGLKLDWDAEIINDEPNALIAWRSLGGADVDNAGSVRFVPGPEGRGTEVHVTLDYIPPAGKLGAWVASLFGQDPASQIREDLRRFKQFMEAGELATTQGQPHAAS
jgi:uncharacterized membrane protein